MVLKVRVKSHFGNLSSQFHCNRGYLSVCNVKLSVHGLFHVTHCIKSISFESRITKMEKNMRVENAIVCNLKSVQEGGGDRKFHNPLPRTPIITTSRESPNWNKARVQDTAVNFQLLQVLTRRPDHAPWSSVIRLWTDVRGHWKGQAGWVGNSC
ncbi:hypothetical protein NPIL_692041 [Nephila pilipes]|uniref:Uncharacterized protein n=1 Tax=Nephila pilipes TaxID=299642 RepID=A0A8X6TPF5_NEPPI|nr:hypothetical protein NPIL_692041 [Nephila pilipes]